MADPTTTSGTNAKPAASPKPKPAGASGSSEPIGPGALGSTPIPAADSGTGSSAMGGSAAGSVGTRAGSGGAGAGGASNAGAASGLTSSASSSSAGEGASADTGNSANRRAEARTRFNSALEEARAGLDALRTDAKERGANYRAMATGTTSDWMDDVKAFGSDARKRAEEVAKTGKSRASDGLSALGRVVSDTATVVDERLGAKYGDYARSAARSMQETAARIEAKEVDELGDDVREFVRKSPGAALGIAAVTGFFLARLFGAGSSKE